MADLRVEVTTPQINVDVSTPQVNIELLGGEPPIPQGTATQYFAGPKTWEELEKEAVAGLKLADSPQFAGMTLMGPLNVDRINAITTDLDFRPVSPGTNEAMARFLSNPLGGDISSTVRVQHTPHYIDISQIGGTHALIYASRNLWLRTAAGLDLHVQPVAEGNVVFFASNELAADNAAIFINVSGAGWEHTSPLKIMGDRPTGELRFTVNDDAHGNYISALVWGLPEATSLWAIKNAALDTTFFSVDGAGLVAASVSVNTPELFNSAGDLKLQPDVQGDVVLFGDTDGNRLVKIVGLIGAARKYVSLAVLDTDDMAHIGRQDANILGLSVDMPLTVDGVCDLEGATTHRIAVNANVNILSLRDDSAGRNLERIYFARGGAMRFVERHQHLQFTSVTGIYADTSYNLRLYANTGADVQVDNKLKATLELEIDGDLNHDGSNVGFYGTAPIAQAVLATGAGRTVDDVITALQNLGLVKQA